MGILDNIAKRVADQIVKSNVPVATPITQAQMQQAQGMGMTGYGNSTGLPRDVMASSVPFNPGNPLVPGAINRVRADGRPDPRRYEYQVAQNINVTETRLVPFKTLRAAADSIDIIRRCIEVLKSKMVGLDWDIVLGEDAAEKIMAETGEKSYTRAMEMAKDKYQEEINRARLFWENPDISNGLVFADWLNMALEDVLVLDALAIWPQKNIKGELRGLQILDGSTIKPLIDDRGMRPQAPYPAFQQILYGFPRSEFSAPIEDEQADGEFTSDDLSYLVRNRRTMSVYGYSPVERALPLADIYLRAQQWMRAEFTDGVVPELFFKTNSSFGGSIDQLRAWENVFNDDLSGQTEQRMRARILPEGFDPVTMPGYAEKYTAAFNDELVTGICGHFGVMPSEIGVINKSGGLGGAGHQSGEASSSEVIGVVPLANWMGKMLTQLTAVYLGTPRELEFKFMPSARKDEEAAARTATALTAGGIMTINEARAKAGLPLLDATEADQPIVNTSAGTFLMSDDGLVALGGDSTGQVTQDGEATPETGKPEETPAAETAPAETPAAETDVEPEETDNTGKSATTDDPNSPEAFDETRQFIRWLRKSPARSFEFKHVPTVYGETLNKFVAVGDHDGARWYAERYLG